MDRMRISGTEPSSVILSQTTQFKKLMMPLNVTNQPKSTVKLGYMYPKGLSGLPAVTLTK